MRRVFLISTGIIIAANIAGAIWLRPLLWSLVLFGPYMVLGFYDLIQTKKAVLRNFPILGHFRYLFEMIRPEIAQYFIETDTSGVPFSREERSVVYQRAKRVRDTVPFGTKMDVYEVGYEWVDHSLQPVDVSRESMRIMIGEDTCSQPYSASRFNISAMSFGSLSKAAILSLSQGAKIGSFAHNTGEGGISPYHIEGGGDLIWQIGTGYFGCRTTQGLFSPERFGENARMQAVKMIEIKLSQGAKPGHGGILPAAKISHEIAEIRGVPIGKDVISPPAHSAFEGPVGLIDFVASLRELSGGKPVGFKLCLGKRNEFAAICKAMIERGTIPDFIAVDGAEGGTGAAPLEFSNHIGTPLIESLIFIHNTLVGYGLRDKIRVIASGKVTTGFDMVKRLALGADVCYSARGMMLAMGCIQALKCNSNHCPVGVATQDPELVTGLVSSQKKLRVANFHRELLQSVREILGAMGIDDPDKLAPSHLWRRTGPTQIQHYAEIYQFLREGELLEHDIPSSYKQVCDTASSETFEPVSIS